MLVNNLLSFDFMKMALCTDFLKIICMISSTKKCNSFPTLRNVLILIRPPEEGGAGTKVMTCSGFCSVPCTRVSSLDGSVQTGI